MKITKIEWCDSTPNPTENCDGCELWNNEVRSCYAGRMTERYKGKGAFDKRPILHPGRMRDCANYSDLRGIARPDKPWIPKEYPRICFIGDMADVFSRDVPFSFLKEEIIDVVTSTNGQRHVWMLLTKQAKRMAEFSQWLSQQHISWPTNLRPGVSVTSKKTTWRIGYLLQINSAHRFISYEPAFEWVDFKPWLWVNIPTPAFPKGKRSNAIAQIITGGASGDKDHPYLADWAADLISDCDHAGVACFVKQMGSRCLSSIDDFHCPMADVGQLKVLWHAALKSPKGGDWSEWPQRLRVRQLPPL